jgi:hypothetical protein
LKLEVLPDVTLYQLVTATGVLWHARRLELSHPEEEGIKFLRNARNYLPVDTIQHSRKIRSSANPLCETQGAYHEK